MATIIRGSVIADHSIIEEMPKAAFKVKSWDNSHSPMTQTIIISWCRARGLYAESSYRTKTRGCWLFIYRDAAGREDCFSLNQG